MVKMKKLLVILLSIGILGCAGNATVLITGMEGKPLPSFTLQLMDSLSRLNMDNIPKGKPVVLFLFNPNCPYCRAQTKELIANIKSFKDVQFYMLSSASFDLIQDYYKHYQIKEYPNITLGRDYENYFGNYYRAMGVPFIAIYDKDKLLKQALIGQVGIRRIKNLTSQ